MNTFLVIKVIHIISVITWMAALFYLPRIFVYHATKKVGTDTSETFKTMEDKLLSLIANPSLVIVWISGLFLFGYKELEVWLVYKMFLVLAMTLFHFYLRNVQKKFSEDQNIKSERFFIIINEIPSVLLIGIIILVVFQPK